MVATTQLEEEEWSDWDDRYQAAATDLDRRDELVLPSATTLGQVICNYRWVSGRGERHMRHAIA